MKPFVAILILCFGLAAVGCEKKAESSSKDATPNPKQSESQRVPRIDGFASDVFQQNIQRAVVFRMTAGTRGIQAALQESSARPELVKTLTGYTSQDAGMMQAFMRTIFATSFFVGLANENHPTNQYFVLYSPFYDGIIALNFGIAGELADIAIYPASRLIDPSKEPTPDLEWLDRSDKPDAPRIAIKERVQLEPIRKPRIRRESLRE